MSLKGANVLVTGGTGSFGKKIVRKILEDHNPEKVIVVSRDELKQFQMRQQLPIEEFPNLRLFLGDVRDRDRMYRLAGGVDTIIHAAALKQIPTAEMNPLEVIKTNVLGAANIIDVAHDLNVKNVIALSTDKAANPINLYGATKLCSDKLFVAANGDGLHDTKFSVVRYGNVVGSRGSVIPYFLAQRSTGVLTITDPRMTRFLITLDQAANFVVACLESMVGGEIFVPKIPSVKVTQLAKVIGPNCEEQIIGIRPGEKLHETMVTEDEARLTMEYDDRFAIQPTHSFWSQKQTVTQSDGNLCGEGFRYRSDTNTWWLTDDEVATLVKEVETLGDGYELPQVSEPRFIVGG